MASNPWRRIKFSTDSITTLLGDSILLVHGTRPSSSLQDVATAISRAENLPFGGTFGFPFLSQPHCESSVLVTRLNKLQPKCIIARNSRMWKGGGCDEDRSYASSVGACLRRSSDEGWHRVLISTEVLNSCGFPSNRHVRLAVAETHRFLSTNENLEVTFVGGNAPSEYKRETLRQEQLLENSEAIKRMEMSEFGVECVSGSIVNMHTDAIVNAANNALRGGGGVDGAIHLAAGPDLLKACKSLGGCATGDAVVTDGFALPASYIIHTVGPVWVGGSHEADELLTSCYMSSLEKAVGLGCRSVAFPAISCGAYGFPITRAVAIAVHAVQTFKKLTRSDIKVFFSCYDAKMRDMYQAKLAKVRSDGEN